MGRVTACPERGSLRTCSRALDLIQRRRVFQRRDVAELFAEIRGAHDAAHHFRVSRFWYVADENHLAWRERFAEIARYALFQFGGEGNIAVCVLLQDAKANERFAFDGIRDADRGGFADLRVRDEN